MFHLKYLIYFILLNLIVGQPQLNLWYTDWVNDREIDNNNNGLQHNCFRINQNEEMMSYCLSEFPSTFKIEDNDNHSKFTFDELSNQNITSQQLYLWSAPIDLIERYQFYLNQLLIKNNSLVLSKDIFYNCTMKRFGPKCQYELYYHYSNHSSVKEIINDFYNRFEYHPTGLTCYIHLKCHRGYVEICLDWTDICNGKIDCFDNGLDEEYCWQLNIHDCKNDEFRCSNGQCVPQSFYPHTLLESLCIDGSDLSPTHYMALRWSVKLTPSMLSEDQICEERSLTSSCIDERMKLLKDAIYSIKDPSASEKCWLAFQCHHKLPNSNPLLCSKFCRREECIKILKSDCPDILYVPGVPVLFGNIYFVFIKTDSQYYVNITTKSFYICYTTSDYDQYFINIIKISINNMTCINFQNAPFKKFYQGNPLAIINGDGFLETLHGELKIYHLIFNYSSSFCNRSNMYQCQNSIKCIPIYHLLNHVDECPSMDDENITIIDNITMLTPIRQNNLWCLSFDKHVLLKFGDRFCRDHYNITEQDIDKVPYIKYNETVTLFQHICDGSIDILPRMIAERNETDETECEQWKCNNIYTRCNGIRNCPNGIDEIGCFLFSSINCSSNDRLCFPFESKSYLCLHINGVTDELNLCEAYTQLYFRSDLIDFYKRNQSLEPCVSRSFPCDGVNQCKRKNVEQIFFSFGSIRMIHYETRSGIKHFLCDYERSDRYLSGMKKEFNEMTMLVKDQTNNIKNKNFVSNLINIEREPRCYRGLDLRVWLNNTLAKDTCLCPLSYYGSQCQFQNQRISFKVRFRALEEFYQKVFSIIILLIDDSNNRIIHYYQQITYPSNLYCKFTFHINLIYSTRPKNLTKQYAIHIDFYEKISFTYRGSELIPIEYPFLPVYPLSLIINIPLIDIKTQNCFNDKCIHGKCIKYLNNQNNLTFCQCKEGWTGKYCTIKHICNCSNDSLCIGISANNQSICMCPPNKFGPRCLITNSICQTNSTSICQQNGQCIWINDYSQTDEEFVCLCKKGFSGKRCHIPDNKLNISFDKNIDLPQQIFIHFIEITKTKTESQELKIVPNRLTTIQSIHFGKTSLIVNWSRPFHLVFIETLNKTYYLTVMQNIYKQSTTILKTIKSSDYCPNVSEILNKNLSELNFIRRIKYYHLPCQNLSLNLSCFYDEIHLCFCYYFAKQRLTNCFNFDHNMKFDCSGKNVCENNGDCFQDDQECPTRSICKCQPCFFGIQCQLNTNGFGLSLDAILGYHILPNININQQLFIVKMSLSLTIIFFLIGLLNSILSMITFKNKSIRDVGCGLYLFTSSINNLLMMLIFLFKYLFLLLSQMNIINNQMFLSIQCYSIDFLLRTCLYMDQWLIASIATERAVTTIKGAKFNKNKSKKTAKYVIIIIFIVIVVTLIHDPISRQLNSEENHDDNTIIMWCIVKYSSFLRIYNYIIQIIHFIGPFLINLISSILLIRTKSLQQANLHRQKSYKEIVREQFKQHKNLLTAPIVLVILAIPRLILIFTSKCMRSPNDAWLFLCGYFISFIPSMLTFIIFILPSKFYKKEFNKTVRQYRAAIHRRLHLFS